MKKSIVTALLSLFSMCALATERVESYNIYQNSVILKLTDLNIELRDFRFKNVPKSVKITEFDDCDGTTSCKFTQVLESEDVLQMTYDYAPENSFNSEDRVDYVFTINFPISSLSLAQVEKLKSFGNGINTNKKQTQRVRIAKELFKESVEIVEIETKSIDRSHSLFCHPEEFNCVEKISYLTSMKNFKKFSVIFK